MRANDSHYKHIPSHSYYDGRRSIFDHPDPEGLLKRFAGTGKPKSGVMGEPGYREVVDFGEYVGIWKEDKIGGLSLPTTRATIHYSKKGAHIVPVHPNPLIEAK
nr:polymorphic toxin type 50 domain-containing protein [Criblamydia sequanensis]